MIAAPTRHPDLVHTVPRLDLTLWWHRVVLTRWRRRGGTAVPRLSNSAEHTAGVVRSTSAHTPHLEESAKFWDLLMDLRTSWLASTW